MKEVLAKGTSYVIFRMNTCLTIQDFTLGVSRLDHTHTEAESRTGTTNTER